MTTGSQGSRQASHQLACFIEMFHDLPPPQVLSVSFHLWCTLVYVDGTWRSLDELEASLGFNVMSPLCLSRSRQLQELQRQQEMERERQEKERQEQERLEREMLEREQERERQERERQEREAQAERERLERERQEQQERAERELMEREKAERERLEREQHEQLDREQQDWERGRRVSNAGEQYTLVSCLHTHAHFHTH